MQAIEGSEIGQRELGKITAEGNKLEGKGVSDTYLKTLMGIDEGYCPLQIPALRRQQIAETGSSQLWETPDFPHEDFSDLRKFPIYPL